MIGSPDRRDRPRPRARKLATFRTTRWSAGSPTTGPPTEPGIGPRRLGSFAQVARGRAPPPRRPPRPLAEADGNGASAFPTRLELFERVAAECLDLSVSLIEVGQLYEELLGHVPLGQSNSAWFQYLLHPRYRAGWSFSKRAFDLVVGGAMLLLLAPVLAVFALARQAHRRRSRLLPPAPCGRARPRVRADQAALDARRLRGRAARSGRRPTTTGSRQSAGSCAASTSTRCRSCSTSCAAR